MFGIQLSELYRLITRHKFCSGELKKLFKVDDLNSTCCSRNMVKRCAWGKCNTDSRYPERLTKDGLPVTFHHFPSITKFKERREAWIRACCHADNFVCTKDSYVCSLRFVGKKGPTEEYPVPTPATASRDQVCYCFLNTC